MPVFRSGMGLAPGWCELQYFEVVRLPPGAAHSFQRIGVREKLIVSQGRVRLSCGAQAEVFEAGANLDLQPDGGRFEVLEALEDAELVRMCGRWGERVGGSGIFMVHPAEGAPERGDPGQYPKHTDIDNHYHDCDEYWIILAGRGVAVSEGQSYEVGPGDCVATGRGHHHDLPQVYEPIRGVYFETTLEGQGRLGHLWDHTHGPAKPAEGRL